MKVLIKRKAYKADGTATPYAFTMDILQGKHGWFRKNPFSNKNFASLVIGLQAICNLILFGLLLYMFR